MFFNIEDSHMEQKKLTSRTPRQIMVVEDDEAVAALLKHLFSNENYEVKVVKDGLDAKKHVKPNAPKPDVMLLEMMLPSVSGYDLLHHVRDTEGWADVPVVVLSSVWREEEVDRAIKLGANDYITKPFHLKQLVARVNQHI
jgi:two-component system alkaline phosphatase synthesis response regulator PhoP